MKSLSLLLLMASLSLAGCATSAALNTPHATLERAETLAEDAYINAVPFFMTVDQQKQAWATLQQIRAAYNAGQDITLASQNFVAALPKKGN